MVWHWAQSMCKSRMCTCIHIFMDIIIKNVCGEGEGSLAGTVNVICTFQCKESHIVDWKLNDLQQTLSILYYTKQWSIWNW